ncbi:MULTISPECIES: DUF4403 family protein [unclassified Roseovarius]|uniref:DUF4403 family protein n=1 Tax=unclassified Roseovarius TaxID=2614913 RepID=UPI00273D4FED|nr:MULTISPECIES: DUF4403 family protein [unclassified Roseovarius]
MAFSIDASPASAGEKASLSVPVSVPLSDIAGVLNNKIPQVLHHAGPRKETCVEAERICTKIPEFRGFKIYSRMECVDVTPRISCDLEEHVARDGPLQVNGSGNRLEFHQNILARATVRGRGEIGKHIRETAHARAAVSLSLSPSLSPDWQLSAPIDVNYRWIDRPQFVLFNLFTVTFAGKVEPQLNAAIADFKQDFQRQVRAIPVHKAASEIWRDLQRRVPIRIHGARSPAYFHFSPETIGFSGLSVSRSELRLALHLTGVAKITTTGDGNRKTPLPNLRQVPVGAAGFDLKVPLHVPYEAVNKTLRQKLPLSLPVRASDELRGEVHVSRAVVTRRDGRLALKLDLATELNGAAAWIKAGGFDRYKGQVTISATPSFDRETQTLRFIDAKADFKDNFVLNALSRVVLRDGSVMSKRLSELLELDLSEDARRIGDGLGRAIRRELTPGVFLDAQASARLIRVQTGVEGLDITAKVVGPLRIRARN